ncbi:UNVERIFIED_CONTAM: hypothetical protein FKN15_035038 [Acipenser sinensis]
MKTGHSTQQQTNKVITSTIQLIHQLSDIISSSSRQDHLRLTRLRSELSESIQRYGDLQKKIAEKSRALLPPTQKDKVGILVVNFAHYRKALDSKLLITSESRFGCQKALSMPSTALLQAGKEEVTK